MKKNSKFESLIKQAEQPFSGWDFSFISETERVKSEPLSWSYGSMAISIIQQAMSMLDMGTGGGEFLSKLGPFPQEVFATEAYSPNVPIVRERYAVIRTNSPSETPTYKLPHFRKV